MIQKDFTERMIAIIKNDPSVMGLAAGGSWITGELDEYSDVDLVLVTKEKISDNKSAMMKYAGSFGTLLAAFTGEHVGEPRLLICLYDEPLLHVDIKFVTLEEFRNRIETPVILLDKNDELQKALDDSTANFPLPEFQWIEDRFWVWVHYAATKIQRGEYFEAYDFFAALRMMVFGPLLHMKNGGLPRGVRKVEICLTDEELNDLKSTLPNYDKISLIRSLENSVILYQKLRNLLFGKAVVLRKEAEKKVTGYLGEIS